MTNLTVSGKVQVVKHLEAICVTTERNTHFIFPCLLPTINRIIMLMNIARECFDFISLANPSINQTLAWYIQWLPIFICITETGTLSYLFLAIFRRAPVQLFCHNLLLVFAHFGAAFQMHSQPTGIVHLLSFLMVTSCS